MKVQQLSFFNYLAIISVTFQHTIYFLILRQFLPSSFQYNQKYSVFSLNIRIYLSYKIGYMFRLTYCRHQADYKNKGEIFTNSRVWVLELCRTVPKCTEPKHFPSATTHAKTVLSWQPWSLPIKLCPYL